MASWTDQIPNFSPYVEQLPVSAYTQTEISAQGQFNQGLQRAQGEVDKIAGLDIAKPSTRIYMQQKLSQMKDALSKNISGDFRDQRLVNQIGGATTQIAGDPIIQNGVISTAMYRKGLGDIQQAQKDGKGAYGTANEWAFMKRANSWLNDGDTNTQFSDTYVPKYDVDKDIKDAVGAAHFDSAEWQDVPKNEDGTPNTDLIVDKMKKGLLRGKVANIVGEVFAKPEVQRQLALDGQYTYRNYSPQMLKQEQDYSLSYYQQKDKEMRNKLSIINTLSKIDQDKANQAIIDADQELQNKTENYNSFMKLLQQNPEEAKVQHYMDNQRERYMDSYSWEENSTKIEKNPAAEMQIERMRYSMESEKFQFEVFNANRHYELSLADEQRKAALAAGKLNADGTPKSPNVTYNLNAVDVAPIKDLGEKTYTDETTRLNDERTQLQAEIITSLPSVPGNTVQYSDMFTKDANGRWNVNKAKYKDWATIAPYYQAAIREIDNQHLNGTVDNDYAEKVQKLYDMNSLIMARQKAAGQIDSKYQPNIAKFNAGMKSNPYNTIMNIPAEMQSRDAEYAQLQGQEKHYTGQFNPKDEKDRLRINQLYTNAISTITEGKKLRGVYSNLDEWTSAIKPDNLNNNSYQFFKDNNGQNFLRIVRADGSGRFREGPPIPVSEEYINQFGPHDDVGEKAFNDTFGGFLSLNKWQSTTPAITSPEAENTAIMRHNIGKYSVGFQLQALDGGYVPYLYIRDRSTGKVLASGRKLSVSAYANDPTISPELRAYTDKASSIVPEQNVLPLISGLNEHYIDLILGKAK